MTITSTASDVLIIGAGPSGLCLAKALLDIPDLSVNVLERKEVGSTWLLSPANLRVLSPWWTNILSFRYLFKRSPFALVNARSYLEHLREFAVRHGIQVNTGVEITSVRPDGNQWLATDGCGRVWRARYLVCATGYFSSPAMPEPEFSSDGSIPVIHASEVNDYDCYSELFSNKTVLLVGKRVTAGQTMVELVDRNVSVVLSADAPIEFHRSGKLAHFVDQAYFLYEAMRIRLQPRLTCNSYPPMEGGRARRMLETGRVPRVERIRSIKDGSAILIDGSRIRADYVLLATGYRPSLDYLAPICRNFNNYGLPPTERFELVGLRGIFLLGFDHLRNFRSRYLRGIRADARLLAKVIGGRVQRDQEKASTS